MRIAGFIPFSLQEFPGRIAAVIFTQGCNFRCLYCHNQALIPWEAPDGRFIPEEDILRFLNLRRGRLGGVVISGGEPTLQADLAEFLRKVKAMGFAVKLETNGSRPEVLECLLRDSLVDHVAMDVKATPAAYSRICGTAVDVDAIMRSISLISQSGCQHEFRTTRVPHLLNDREWASVAELIPRGSVHVWQEYRRVSPVNASGMVGGNTI